MKEKPSPLDEDFSMLTERRAPENLAILFVILCFHNVWITKYRKPVLRGEIAKRARDLIRKVCKTKEIEVIRGHVSRDHVHIFVSVPSHISVSQLV
ncbi:MAG: IS200/IS605 family transposase [Candidatus Scalindua sp.]|nr:IS200/IS605 family transposase [Candidatus Scalindua sp.]